MPPNDLSHTVVLVLLHLTAESLTGAADHRSPTGAGDQGSCSCCLCFIWSDQPLCHTQKIHLLAV